MAPLDALISILKASGALPGQAKTPKTMHWPEVTDPLELLQTPSEEIRQIQLRAIVNQLNGYMHVSLVFRPSFVGPI